MILPEKISRIGLALAKLSISHQSFFLMRRSRKWNDISFIGGHESDRDGGKLSRAAYRELMEEVPALRRGPNFELEPLTSEFCYGPTYSQSAKMFVGYELQFFFINFLAPPVDVLRSLTPRSPNILLSEEELLHPQKYVVSGLVDVLNGVLDGGLNSIRKSWPGNLDPLINGYAAQDEQIHLQLK